MNFKINGAVLRHGLHSYSADDNDGLLPEDHQIPAERLQSFIDAGLVEEVEVVRKVVRVPPPNPARRGVWDYDPEVLAGLTLARLNAMIAERDPKGLIGKFSNKDKAVRFLSQHFNPAAPKAQKRVILTQTVVDPSMAPAPAEVAAQVEPAIVLDEEVMARLLAGGSKPSSEGTRMSVPLPAKAPAPEGEHSATQMNFMPAGLAKE